MRICCLQHVPFETPGQIAGWARSRGHSVIAVRLFAGEIPPPVEAFDWLVVMGGPMGAYDDARFPLLPAEARAIADAVEATRIVVGVCLGAQLIARVAGARVYRNTSPEIGWFPVKLTAAGRTHPLTQHLPTAGLAWLAAGGLLYTVGVVFYAWERLRYGHVVWHLFVLGGSACHFVAVLRYAGPAVL